MVGECLNFKKRWIFLDKNILDEVLGEGWKEEKK